MQLYFNDDLMWSSDWNGYEVGYPEIGVVGLYSLKINPDIMFYIDMENERLLESFVMCDNCDCPLNDY